MLQNNCMKIQFARGKKIYDTSGKPVECSIDSPAHAERGVVPSPSMDITINFSKSCCSFSWVNKKNQFSLKFYINILPLCGLGKPHPQ